MIFYWVVVALAVTTVVLWLVDEWDRHHAHDDDPYREDPVGMTDTTADLAALCLLLAALVAADVIGLIWDRRRRARRERRR